MCNLLQPASCSSSTQPSPGDEAGRLRGRPGTRRLHFVSLAVDCNKGLFRALPGRRPSRARMQSKQEAEGRGYFVWGISHLRLHSSGAVRRMQTQDVHGICMCTLHVETLVAQLHLTGLQGWGQHVAHLVSQLFGCVGGELAVGA